MASFTVFISCATNGLAAHNSIRCRTMMRGALGFIRMSYITVIFLYRIRFGVTLPRRIFLFSSYSV